MKEKMQRFAPMIATTVMGILLIFFSINLFGKNVPAMLIIYGILGLLIGLGYLVVAVLGIAARNRSGAFTGIASLILLAGFPLYILFQQIVMIWANGGASASGWIISVLLWLLALAQIVFAVVQTFSPAAAGKLESLSVLVLCGLMSVLVLTFIFDVDGGVNTLANLSLFELAIFAAYAVIAFTGIKGSGAEPKGEA